MVKLDPREKLVLMLIMMAIRLVSKYGVSDIKEDLDGIKSKIKNTDEG